MENFLSKSQSVQNRIKRIMQSNEDVGKVAAGSTYLVASVLDRFITDLLSGAVEKAAGRGAKTLSTSHLKAQVSQVQVLDFCKDVVARAPDLIDAQEMPVKAAKRQRGKTIRDDEAAAEGKRKKKKAKKELVKTEEEEVKEEEHDAGSEEEHDAGSEEEHKAGGGEHEKEGVKHQDEAFEKIEEDMKALVGDVAVLADDNEATDEGFGHEAEEEDYDDI